MVTVDVKILAKVPPDSKVYDAGDFVIVVPKDEPPLMVDKSTGDVQVLELYH